MVAFHRPLSDTGYFPVTQGLHPMFGLTAERSALMLKMLESEARSEWVNPTTETRSSPGRAISPIVTSVTLPPLQRSRSFKRGIEIPRVDQAAAYSLQWGRALLSAEWRSAACGRWLMVLLQWGRALLSAE